MPELPEVETMCRGIAGCVGRRITAAALPRGRVRPITTAPRPAVLARQLAGRTIAGVFRRGKRVVLEVAAAGAAPLWLVIEPRMTGLMLVADPPSAEHVRLELSLHADRGAAVERLLFWDQRGLGTIRLLDARGLERACGAAKLGPDGLVVTADELVARLSRSRRAVKVALLDQRAVAGIGNIYAAEILFRAGVDPRTSCRRLCHEVWARIAASARVILAAAVRHEGSSIGDETYQTATGTPGRFQQRHRVYGREGRPCSRCRTPIVRIVQAQRSTFYCPQCQVRRPRRSHSLPGASTS